jgi:starch synthase (maltosyl-transferring)
MQRASKGTRRGAGATKAASAAPDPREAAPLPADGRARAVVEGIEPSVDMGRFAAKRVVGDRVVIEADCFADGHDVVAARLR